MPAPDYRRPDSLAFSLFTLLAALLTSPALPAVEAGEPISVLLHQMIPMRDGVSLAATVWKPAHMDEALPAVLVMTPYISDEAHVRGKKFARADYVYISVDVRGRGASEGVNRPLYGHGPDGVDLIRWIVQQPWSDGRVAMRGGSYRGMTQWQVMAEDPEHLVAAIPTASAYPGHDFPNPNGILLSYAARWLAFTSGHTGNDNLFGDTNYWQQQFVRNYRQHLPFSQLADLAGTNGDVFLEWLDHPVHDAYWTAYNPTPEDYAAIDIPILTVTGYFDGDQPGAMRYYREHLTAANDAARKRHYLLMGPWNHGGTRHPQAQVGGLSFPDNAVIDMDQLQIDWLNWVLKDGKRPELLADRVTYYVMGEGAEAWRHADSLAAIHDATLKLYLSSPGINPDSVFNAGSLVRSPPEEQAPDSYRYDPRKVKDKASLLEDRGDRYLVDPLDAFGDTVLVYHGAALDAPLTIAGVMRFVGHISLDVPDTDIVAEVQAILPDGETLVLGYDAVRARFRNGPGPDFAEPGVVDRYVFDDFLLTARRLPAGTRLRLILFPLDAPQFQRNYNTGGRPGYESVEDARAADVNVHLGANQPSFLELPIATE